VRFSFLTFFLLVLVASRTASSQPLIIEAYGDSVMAGFAVLENFSKPAGQVRQLHRKLVRTKILSKLHLVDIENKTAQHAHSEYAFPYVIAQKLKARGREVYIINQAVTGARTKDLSGQVVGNAGQKGEKVIAFFMMGHNDLCRGDDEGAFSLPVAVRNYQQALIRWDLSHTNATAFLVPIADIPRVYRTLDGFHWASNATPNQSMTCRESWTNRFPFCKHFSNLYFSGNLERVVGSQRRDLNGQLGQLGTHMTANSRRGNRFIYLDGALDGEYIPDQFAVDCFHLSTRGQFALAEAVYRLIDAQI